MKKKNTAPQLGSKKAQARAARLRSSASVLPSASFSKVWKTSSKDDASSLWSWFWPAAKSSVKGWQRWWR